MIREAKRFVTLLLTAAVVATSVPVVTDAAEIHFYDNGEKVHTVSGDVISINGVSANGVDVKDNFLGWKYFDGTDVSENTIISGNAIVSVNAVYGQEDDNKEDDNKEDDNKEDDNNKDDDNKDDDNKDDNNKDDDNKDETNKGEAECKDHKWVDVKVTKEATYTAEGEKEVKCSVCGETKKVTIAKKVCTDHKWDEGKVTKEATTTEEGVKTFTCTVCGETKTETIAKLPVPTIKLNAKSIKLQKGKSTTAIVASGLIEGDKVVKWESSNKKIVTVSKKGKITGKKVGNATITVTTEKGAKATLKVTVQKKAVALKKLTVDKKKVTLKVGKTHKIIATKSPLTAQDKVTYTSSNKKVATVSKSGLIKAKKKGSATITVKAGKKIVKIKVTVKKK